MRHIKTRRGAHRLRVTPIENVSLEVLVVHNGECGLALCFHLLLPSCCSRADYHGMCVLSPYEAPADHKPIGGGDCEQARQHVRQHL